MIRVPIAIISALVLLKAAAAQSQEEYSVCRIASVLQAGERIEFTGFKVKGVAGIYTALHGVHGAKQVDAIFHDPKTRRVPMKISEVDVSRDVALLVPANAKDPLPKGGLGLGVWPPRDRIESRLTGKPANVIGYPLGIDLAPATTDLTIRKPAVVELTVLLNPSARRELAPRGSPSTAARMLSLQGPFLPGHSGAPILDADRAVIGIGIGGLGEGRVGHGWAAPFHELQLKPVSDSDVIKQLGKVPVHRRGYSFFLVVDDAVRSEPERMALVTTTVESDDGSPILALRKKPGDEIKNEVDRLREILQAMRNGENDKFTAAGEFERIMKNRLYLPSGTPVEVLSEPEQFKMPAGIPADERNMRAAMNQLYTRVQVVGNKANVDPVWVPTIAIRRRAGAVNNVNINNNNIINSGNSNIIGSGNSNNNNFNIQQNSGAVVGPNNRGPVIVNPPPKMRKKQILNNAGGPTLVLKQLGNNPLSEAVDLDNHLAILPVGTEVRLLNEQKAVNPFLVFRKIEILSGEYRGKTGWVSRNSIREVEARE